jgi:hypothetical protein
MQIPVFTEDAEVFSNGALVNALLAGLDDWYRLSEIDRPEDNMYAIKFLMTHDPADSTQVITTRDLVAIEGEAYRLKLDLEDKWLAACRASVLYNKETPASRLLTREQMESCMATYLELLQNEKLNEVMSQQEHIPTSDLFTPKYIWKPFSKKVLTNTICEEPGVQADITEYAEYISEYLQRLATSINVFGCKEVGDVKARVTLFGTSIVVPAPDGTKVRVKVPAGTQPGAVFSVKGKGAPRVKGAGNGNLKVKLDIEVPTQLNEAQRKALEDYIAASN